jgi:hypothetical protein
MTVYVIGDNPSLYAEDMAKYGYRVVNSDVGAPVKEMFPTRISLLLQANRAYLVSGWENSIVCRMEYTIAEGFGIRFLHNVSMGCDRVIQGKYLEVIREMAELVCELYDNKPIGGVFVSKAERRSHDRIHVKQVVFYILKRYGFNVIHISKALPNAKRCDVYHAVKTISGYMVVDRVFRLKMFKLLEALYNIGYVNTYVHNERLKSYEIDDNSPNFSSEIKPQVEHA